MSRDREWAGMMSTSSQEEGKKRDSDCQVEVDLNTINWSPLWKGNGKKWCSRPSKGSLLGLLCYYGKQDLLTVDIWILLFVESVLGQMECWFNCHIFKIRFA